MGIVLNKGIKYPKVTIEQLDFGKNTPYERSYVHNKSEGIRVLSDEVSSVLKSALFNIVADGTAIRLKDGIKIGDQVLQVGGKTGTGDHRYKVYSKGGGLSESRVVNRTATFMFILGDKYFGVITAFVPGSEASKFKFTSALPVQLLKLIGPDLALKENSSSKPLN
jgi:membrane peptidoglycan carboxypeptidase